MAIVFLLLSLGAAVAAVALWRAANKQDQSAPVAEPQPAQEVEPEPEPPAEQESEVDEPESEPVPEPEPVAQPEHHARLVLPGAVKRERKHWAEAKNFEFLKSDDYLADEWTRGAAASGAAPRDIVVGNVFGHEMLLMDLGGINVMAMRTGAASEEVIDFRRGDALTQESSQDLMEAFAT